MEQEMNIDALSCVAEIEISYKPKVKASQRPVIRTSQDAWHMLLKTWDPGRIELSEQFRMMLLNRAGRLLGIIDLYDGAMDAVSVDRRLIFATALKSAASSIIVAHNHPSGSLRPSKEDEKTTRLLKDGGKILGIKLQDHIIVTPDGYFSFADGGLL